MKFLKKFLTNIKKAQKNKKKKTIQNLEKKKKSEVIGIVLIDLKAGRQSTKQQENEALNYFQLNSLLVKSAPFF